MLQHNDSIQLWLRFSGDVEMAAISNVDNGLAVTTGKEPTPN
jgi:hypothetical protein